MKKLTLCVLPCLLAGCLFGTNSPLELPRDTGPETSDLSTDHDAADTASNNVTLDMGRDDTGLSDLGGGDLGRGDMAVSTDVGPDAPTDLCAGVDCLPGTACVPGTGLCESICEATQEYCGACVNVGNDPVHCGACDLRCEDQAPANAHAGSCTNRICVYECDAGYADINRDLGAPNGDGCEATCTPSAEVCDGVDNDCNGLADDNLPQTTYYADNDGDGYGDANNSATFCEATPPPGWTAGAGDCDDSSEDISPSVGEICDGLDNNCSGAIDEGLPIRTWWQDADGDGVGGNTTSLPPSCAASPGPEWVSTSNDCDDSESSNFPGNVEVCDGADNDCDGLADDGLSTSAYYRDQDNDTWGTNSDVVQSCRPLAGRVTRGGDCDDTNGAVHPGAPEICDGVDSNCSGGGEVPTTYYLDTDGDGYGGASTAILCAPTGGYSTVGGDCDDTTAARAPGLPEICDGLDNDCNNATNDAGMAECTHTLFVTSQLYPGNFNANQTADAKCAALGSSVSNSWGSWKAVIMAQQPAAQRIRQIGIVRNTAGELLFTVNGLFGGSPFNAIGYDESGNASVAATWTGSTSSGTAGANHCNGFTTNLGTISGVTGTPTFADGRWLNNSTSNCSKTFAFYCINGQ